MCWEQRSARVDIAEVGFDNNWQKLVRKYPQYRKLTRGPLGSLTAYLNANAVRPTLFSPLFHVSQSVVLVAPSVSAQSPSRALPGVVQTASTLGRLEEEVPPSFGDLANLRSSLPSSIQATILLLCLKTFT